LGGRSVVRRPKFELVINAQPPDVDLIVPPTLLASADEVIE
jgi:hypothetical protein